MGREIPYSKFFKNYLIPNQPCIFSKKFTEDWNCRKNWITADGKPNFQRLLHEFDETPVPVANCSAKEYNSNPKQILPFKEFIQYWREYIQNGHSSPKGCLYLKDWHMQSKKEESSPVWDFFLMVGHNKVKCLLCPKEMTYNNYTSSMLRHYRALHEHAQTTNNLYQSNQINIYPK
ncbi:jmjC domain-containing protein 4-like [Carassius auratus]|uniref:JmjC domain-containing protein 4-like n=1 Tax=Carassius auratus TaxID=7957 RepID=A0A6P6J0E2_CARAU|nr:jmjC domain-containing protein 4-like [Carassius auratus]